MKKSWLFVDLQRGDLYYNATLLTLIPFVPMLVIEVMGGLGFRVYGHTIPDFILDEWRGPWRTRWRTAGSQPVRVVAVRGSASLTARPRRCIPREMQGLEVVVDVRDARAKVYSRHVRWLASAWWSQAHPRDVQDRERLTVSHNLPPRSMAKEIRCRSNRCSAGYPGTTFRHAGKTGKCAREDRNRVFSHPPVFFSKAHAQKPILS